MFKQVLKTERRWGQRGTSVSLVAQSFLTLFNPMDCSTPTPGVYSNSCPLSWWCHPAISSSVIPFSSRPSIFPSIRVFSNESVLRIRWPKYWNVSFSISPMNIQDWIPLGWTGWLSLQSKGLSRVFSNTTVWKHQFFGAQLYSPTHIHTWLLEKPQLWLDICWQSNVSAF